MGNMEKESIITEATFIMKKNFILNKVWCFAVAGNRTRHKRQVEEQATIEALYTVDRGSIFYDMKASCCTPLSLPSQHYENLVSWHGCNSNCAPRFMDGSQQVLVEVENHAVWFCAGWALN